MRRILISGGLTAVSLAALLIFGCGGGGYGGGGYGGGGPTYGGGGSGAPGGVATSISITPATASVAIGGTQQFTATAKDSAGKTVSSSNLTWKSSNTAVATVNNSGLATAVSAGSATITAASSYLGTTYTSNAATLTVTTADAVMGTAAVGHALVGALVTLQDAKGRTQTAITARDGRFQLSTAGMQAPFLLKADDGRGRVLFGAAAQDGVGNIDTATDLMLRGWYGARGTSPEAAFAAHAAAPGADSLAALDAGFVKLMRDSLSAQGVDTADFSLAHTAFNADSTGFDRVLDGMSVSATAGGLHLELSGRSTDIAFGHGSLALTTQVADGQALSTSQLELP